MPDVTPGHTLSIKCALVWMAHKYFSEGARDTASVRKRLEEDFPGIEIDDAGVDALFKRAAKKYVGDPPPVDGDVRRAQMELAKTMQGLERSTWVEAATGLVRAGMLSGGIFTRTPVGNVVGNVGSIALDEISKMPSSMLDLLLDAGKTRTVSPGRGIGAGLRGSFNKETAGEIWQVLRTGVTNADLDKWDVPKEINMGDGPIARTLSAYANGVFRIQSAADVPFRRYSYGKALVERSWLEGWNKGMRGKTLDEHVLASVAAPSESVQALAYKDMLESIFANENSASNVLKAAKRAAGKGLRSVPGFDNVAGRLMGEGLEFALDATIPFTTVPSNIAGRALESTPLGALVGMGEAILGRAAQKRGSLADRLLRRVSRGEAFDPLEVRRRGVVRFGRGVTGTALVTTGYLLVKHGLATITGDYDAAHVERNRLAGRQPNSLQIGERFYRLTDSIPGMMMALGAALFENEQENLQRKVPESPLKIAGEALMSTATNTPSVQGIQELSQATSGADALARTAAQTAGNLVPSFVGDIAAETDLPRRESQVVRRGGAGARAKIPGLRQGVPTEYDALGQPVERPGTFNRFGGLRNRAESDPVVRELVKHRINVTRAGRQDDDQAVDYDATDAEWMDRVRFVGERVREELQREIERDGYRGATAARKKERLKEAYSSARSAAMEEYRYLAETGRRFKWAEKAGSNR